MAQSSTRSSAHCSFSKFVTSTGQHRSAVSLAAANCFIEGRTATGGGGGSDGAEIELDDDDEARAARGETGEVAA